MKMARIEIPMPETCSACRFLGATERHANCYFHCKAIEGPNDFDGIAVSRAEICPLVEVDKTSEMKLQDMYIWFANNLDCDTSFSGESVSELISKHAPDWCEENCDDMNTPKCWQKYFDLKFIEELSK